MNLYMIMGTQKRLTLNQQANKGEDLEGKLEGEIPIIQVILPKDTKQETIKKIQIKKQQKNQSTDNATDAINKRQQ